MALRIARCPLCRQRLARNLSTSVARSAEGDKAPEIPAHILALQEAERAKAEASRYKRPVWTGTLKPGTPLGFKVYKDQPEPVALDDKEYPDWLWKLLDRPSFDGDPQRPGQVNRRDPIKEIRRQLDKDRASARHQKRMSQTL